MPKITTDKGILRILSTAVNDLEVSDIVEQLSISIPDKALGLSAPQIGIHKRAFLANLSSGSYVFINPTITEQSPDEVASTEACLSLPGITRCIGRHSEVVVSCDKIISIKDGSVATEPEPMRVENQDAFIVQHETDHLDGILITDHPEVTSPELATKQLVSDREKDRKKRIAKNRLEKANKKPPPPKPIKMNAKRLAKKKKEALKSKRQRRTAARQEKVRVEIQERCRAEQEGLLNDHTISTESTENQESAQL